MARKALLLGATGAIGKDLVEKLLQDDIPAWPTLVFDLERVWIER